MATIRKRGAKWQAQIRRQGHPPVSKSFYKKSDAQHWTVDTEAAIQRGDPIGEHRDLKRITLGELLRHYRETVTPAKRGSDVETIRLHKLEGYPMALLPLSLCIPAEFAKYRDQRLTQVASATVRRELTILRHVFEVARKEWAVPLPSNPVANIRRPTDGQPRERRLRPGEFERLIDGCGRGRSPLLAPIIKFAVETAMRRGEILSFQWQDVGIDTQTLIIRDTKNGHPRTIPLSKRATAVLREVPRTNKRAFPVSPNALRLAWERLKRRVAIEDLHFHDLRHEAISRLFERGLNVPEVALISGHRDPRMLLRYAHILDMSSTIAKLERHFQ